MRGGTASKLDHAGNRELMKFLGQCRSEFLANQQSRLSERLFGQTGSPFLAHQVVQNSSVHFTEVRCSSLEVGILRFFLVGRVTRKDRMPTGRRVQVLLLDFCLDLIEDGRISEHHSLSIENVQVIRIQGGSETVNTTIEFLYGCRNGRAKSRDFSRDLGSRLYGVCRN